MEVKQLKALGWIAVSSQPQATEDKFSLEKQEADIRQLCQQNNWDLVAMLKVPGFSRDYYTMAEAAEAMRGEGITAFDDLRRHIEGRTFNIFVTRDGDRFGRTLSLIAEVTGKVRDIGAQIYTLAGGAIDSKGATMWSAFAGLKAQSDIERLVEYRQAGSIKNAQRGIPSGSKVICSHTLVRDPATGKAQKLIVNEEKRRLFEDAAELLIAGVGWNEMGVLLYHRGHVTQSGNAYAGASLHTLFHSPTLWGNTGYGYRRMVGGNKWFYGLWCFDPQIPPPEGVLMFYNTHEPMLKGELAEKAQAEMRRRVDTIRGRAGSRETGPFTGLVLCHYCGYATSLRASHLRKDGTRLQYYGCVRQMARFAIKVCESPRGYVTIPSLQKQITEKFLKPLMEGVSLEELLTPAGNPAANIRQQIDSIENEIETLRKQTQSLIRLQVKFPDMEDQYAEELRQTKIIQGNLESRLLELEQQERQTGIHSAQRTAVKELRAVYDRFWEQDSRTINQMLHRLLGRWRFVLKDGELTELR